MSLEEQMRHEIGEEMAKAIDWQVMAGMLIEMGWTVVQLPRFVDNHHAIDIREWIDKSCIGKTDNNGATWIFEKPVDATMFTLKWVQ